MAFYSTTLLQIIQQAAKRLGIPSPSAVISSTDPQVIQLLALANEEGEELQERHPWTSLQTETTFTTLAANLQGALTTIAPGFKWILNDTMWNRTTRVVVPPIDERGWQAWKATGVTGPYPCYRIQANSIYFIPTPTAIHTIAFEYQDKRWCMDTTEATNQAAWAADNDLARIDPQLMVIGIMWRWKRAKGFEYAQEFDQYERRVVNAIARDGAKPTLMLDGAKAVNRGVTIPDGSWNL